MPMKKKIVFNVQLKQRDIFFYKMYHTFAAVLGRFRIGFSVIFLILTVETYGRVHEYETLCLLTFALLNPVVTPLLFWSQSVKLAKGQREKRYVFTEDGFTISEGKTSAGRSWQSLERVIWSRKELLLYTSPYEALVLPRRMMGKQEEELLKLIRESGASGRLRLLKCL